MSEFVERAFSAENAANYDESFRALGAIKDLMHLMLQVRFGELPENAHLLIAGAGTGAEVRHLAPRFPNFRFTLADPSSGMLDIARAHAEAEGFADRCTFHDGYVATLDGENFDAATSILVSHFLTDIEERGCYFQSIADRLVTGAPFFNVDLSGDRSSADFERSMALWVSMIDFARQQDRAFEFRMQEDAPAPPSYREVFDMGIAKHAPAEVEALMRRAGFEDPTPCFQVALMRGWFATRR